MSILSDCIVCGAFRNHGHQCDPVAVRLTSSLAAANQQLDAMRAELAEAKAFVDFTRLHVCNARADKAESELAALRQSTEADAEPVACNRPCVSSSSLCAMPRNHYGYCSPLCPAPVAPVPAPSPSAKHGPKCGWPAWACDCGVFPYPQTEPVQDATQYVAAPSPSARAEEPYTEKDYPALRAAASKAVDAIDNAGLPGTWIVRVTRDHRGVLFRDGNWIAKNAVVKFDHDFAPPDLTAEIARLMMEKERKQHLLEERDAEIAKLKAEAMGKRFRAYMADGTGREKIVTGWLACNDDPDSTCLWFSTKKAARKRLAMWRDSRSRSRLWLVRLVRKPASGGGT